MATAAQQGYLRVAREEGKLWKVEGGVGANNPPPARCGGVILPLSQIPEAMLKTQERAVRTTKQAGRAVPLPPQHEP